MKERLWSPFPPHVYTLPGPDKTLRFGPGRSPDFQDIPTWNLYWLTEPSVDNILTMPASQWCMVENWPQWGRTCAATVEQKVRNRPLGDWIWELNAAEFVVWLTHCTELESLQIYKERGAHLMTTIRERVAQQKGVERRESNIVFVRFR